MATALTGAVVALDQVTKQIAASSVGRGDSVSVALGVEISNVRNKGVAFGLLGGGETLVLVLTLGALALLMTYFVLHAGRRELWIAVGLVAGGALGNLADRVRAGAVIDFLDPPLWPAFNVADAAIVVGVAVLAVSIWQTGARM
jgi:signal peptidase II